MEKEIIIADNDVLKKLGESLISKTSEYDIMRIEEEQINNILDCDAISFEHKKEIFEKIALIKCFSTAYIGPDPRGKEHYLYNASKIFNIKNDSEYEDKIKNVDMVLKLFKEAVMNPFNTTRKMMEDKIQYRNVKF